MLRLRANNQYRFVALVVLVLVGLIGLIGSKLVSASSEQPVIPVQREFYPASKAVGGGRVMVHAPKTSPGFHLQDGSGLQGGYRGDTNAIQALHSGSAEPLGMATDDLDNDGAPDLVAGFSAAGRGVIAVYRGNLDAFAPSSPAVYQAIRSGRIPAAFDSTIQAIDVPETPDFIAIGDFNNDGNKDILTASRGGGMYLLGGDGQGGFGVAVPVSLPGQVTALSAGEFNRTDGKIDVAVGIIGANGSAVLVFDGAANGILGQPSKLSLASPASSIAFDNLDNDSFRDLVVGSDSQVVIVHGQNQVAGKTYTLNSYAENVNVGFNVRSLTTGPFIWNRDGNSSIALLGDDGSIHLMQRNDLDQRPFSPAEAAAIKRDAIRGNNPGRSGPVTRVKSNGKVLDQHVQWSLSTQLDAGLSPSTGSSGRQSIVAAQISHREVSDLLIVDQANSKVVLVRPADAQSQSISPLTMSVEGNPTAVLAMPAKVNGERDLMVMVSGQSTVTALTVTPGRTITVNRTDDSRVSTCAGGTNDCSLRGAIDFANANPGTTIVIPAGEYDLSLPSTMEQSNANGDLDITASGTTIVGAGASLTTIKQMVADRVLDVNFNSLQNFTFGMSGVAIQSGRDQSGLGGGGLLGGGLSNQYTITNSIFDSNDAVNAAGGALSLVVGGNLSITGTTFTNNGITTTHGGAVNVAEGSVTAHFNRFVNNLTNSGANGNAVFVSASDADFSDNWWANIGGPKAGDAVASGGTLRTSPSLTLSLTPDSQQAQTSSSNSSTTITAAFLRSNGRNASNLGVVVGLPVTFSSTSGSIIDSDSTVQSTGTASATLSGASSHIATATIDGATASIGISAVLPPTISIAFGAASIPVNGTTSLTFTVSNPNASALNNVAVVDNFPAGMVVANPANIGGGAGCAGAIIDAIPGSGNGGIHGSGLGANVTCSFSFDITSTTNGIKTNTTNAITSTESGPGGTATATIHVEAPPVLQISFTSTSVRTTQPSGLQIQISNPGTNPDNLTNVSFTTTLPTGIHVNNASATVCPAGGTVTLTNPSTITMTGGIIAPGISCPFVITIRTDAHGVYPISFAVNSANGGTGNTDSATLTVSDAPTLTTSFTPAAVPVGGLTTLTINITNPNTTSLSSLSFTDTLPSGLQVSGTPNLTNSCGGTATATAGSNQVTLTNGGLAGSASCSISVSIQGTTAGVKNNGVQVNSSEGGLSNTSNASITVAVAPVIIKAFGAASIPLNGSTSLTFTIQNNNTGTGLTGVGFTDALPAGLKVSTPNGLTGSCGGGTITATAGTASVSLSGGSIAANSSCTFAINVTGVAAGVQNNTTGNVTSTEGGTGGTASASVTVIAPPSIAKVFNPTSISLNATTSLTFTIINPNPSDALTGVAFSDTLPTGLTVLNASATVCGGTATLTAPSTIALTGATVNAAGQCQFSVTVTGAASGNYTNTTGNVTSTNGGTGNTATANLSVAFPPTVLQQFGGTTFALNQNSAFSITITNPNSTNLTGVAFTDNLPAGVQVFTPNGLSNNCGGTVTATPGSSVISLSGGTLGTGASNTCSVVVLVQFTTAGVKNNSLQVASNEGGLSNTSNASFTVVAPPVIIKAFGAASIPLNGSTSLQFTIQNNNAGTALHGVGFTDILPSGLVVSTPNGLSGSCGGGTINATPGSGSISLSPNAVIAANSQCQFSVNVSGIAAGLQNNTTFQVVSNEGGLGGTASASVNVEAPPTIAKVFNPTSIALNATTSLTFTITNPAGNVDPLTGVAFTDNLPAGLTVVNASATVCGGTVTLTAPSTITMAGATVAANSQCQFSVTVTGAAAGQHTNTTGNVTSTNGGTGNTATATVTVGAPPTTVKSFSPGSIPLNGTSTLSINIANPNGSLALTGIAFTDSLPAGLVVGSAPNVSNTCGGIVTATPGSGIVSLSGGSLAASANCTVSVTVQGTTAGIKNNSVQVTSTEGGTGNSANASLTVVAPPVIIKAFGAASIPLNGSTSLQFTIQNNNPTTTVTGVGFSDTLPAGLVIATPNGLTGSCGGGTITATQNTNQISLSGGSVAANSQCQFSINVTGIAAGLQSNTTSQVTSIEGGTGGTASASVVVEAPPSIAAFFNPSTIAVNSTTSLNFTITNPAVNVNPLTGVAFSDNLPAGLTVTNASATVCGGTLTLTAPSTIALSGATINPNQSCIFSVTVTGTASGVFTNTTGNVTSTNGGTGNTASASLNVASPPTIVKFFGTGTMPVNQTTSLNFTITNPNGTLGLTGIGFTDNLPAGLVVATPNGLSGSCGAGVVTATAGSGTVSLTGGTIAASSTCTFAVNVTATTAGAKVNTTGPVSSIESGAGGTATASINIVTRSTTTAVSFSANPVVSGQTLQVTATVVDTDAGPKSNPSGTVNFSSAAGTDQFDPASCALAPVNNSTTTSSCTVNLSSTTINTHNITAAYVGSAVHAPSSGSSPLTVNKANTSSVLVSSANPSVFGQSVTFTVTVSAVAPGAGIPTGNVTFLDGATTLTSTALNGSGVASFTTSALSVATHPISVTYAGDANFNGSTSNTVNQVVNKDATSTAIASSVNPSSFGQNVTFTATVTANAPGSGTPTGTVTFFDGATQIGTGTLNNAGVATFATATLSVATHPITAVYGGDGNFITSTSSILNQVVNKATTATVLTSSVNPSVFGQTVTFTATVTSTGPAINNPGGAVDRGRRTRTVNPNLVTPSFGIGTPTGTVTFFDGATQIGTATLNGSGVGTFATASLSVGSHSITAVYNGDVDFLTSTSNVVTQVVNKANTTTANVTSSANPSVFGQPVTLSTTVTATAPGAGTPTGTVTFFDGATQIGTATLNGSGVGSITVSTFSVGSHSITAQYGGDGNFNASQTAAATVQVVNKANTTTNIVANPNPAFVHTTVTFTATIVPVAPGAGVPTGTVQFKDNGVNIGGPVTLVNATASVTESNLTPGNHVITAVYSGDGNFNPSTGTLSGGLNVGFKFVDATSGNTLIVIPPANGQSGNGTCTWINNGTNIITNSPCGVEFNQQTLRVRSDTPSLNGLFDATTQVGQAILFANGKSFVLNTNSIVLF